MRGPLFGSLHFDTAVLYCVAYVGSKESKTYAQFALYNTRKVIKGRNNYQNIVLNRMKACQCD